MEAGRLFQGGSSCKQSQSVAGLIVLVLTGLLTAVFLNFLREQRPGQEVELQEELIHKAILWEGSWEDLCPRTGKQEFSGLVW